jgi:uncharacterized protein YuzE
VTSVNILRVTKDGFSISVGGEEFFMSFERYPWFERAPLWSVVNVELRHDDLRWPDLDIDLHLDSLRHPEKYPLRCDPIQRVSPVKFFYAADEDQLHITLVSKSQFEGEEVIPGLVFHYDQSGNVVGIDVDHAVARMELPPAARAELIKALGASS